ncbi:hypothetical protein BGX26_011750 [Mortierella sp. AD094]|nr:hypothetical protein BGX26_011750 [Mortierella sp. AD094]
MFKHVYPSWHKTAQRFLLVIAAALCVALPVAYGVDSVSSAALGAVLGAYFGLWLAFSLIVRFLVPSPNVEPSLPVYTHSPPVPSAPRVLHTPNRSDAQPLASAIKVHPSAIPSTTKEDDKISFKGARFADPEDSPPPTQEEHHPRHRNVTFQTRPRAGTADSTNSTVFPTFAAYRQAQNNSTIEAFAKRVKKAFVLSQQQQEQARIEEILRRQQAEEEEEERQLRELEQQQQQQRQQQQDIPMQTTRQRSSSNALPMSSSSLPTGGNRLRSSSAASMFSDIAERIKNGTLFKRSSSYTSAAAANASAMDEENAVAVDCYMDDKQSEQGSRVGGEKGEPGLGGLSGIEILVTPSEHDHPLTDDDAAVTTGHVKIDTDTENDADAQKFRVYSIPASAPATTTDVPATAPSAGVATVDSRPGYRRTNTRERSPLACASNMVTMNRDDR